MFIKKYKTLLYPIAMLKNPVILATQYFTKIAVW
jgi:hypothetical protein